LLTASSLGRRQSNPPKSYGTELEVTEIKAKTGLKRKDIAIKTSQPKKRKVKAPVHYVDSSNDENSDDSTDDPKSAKESTHSNRNKKGSKSDPRTADASAEHIQEISRLKAELEALKKEKPPLPPLPPPPPPPPPLPPPPLTSETIVPQSLPNVSSKLPPVTKELATVHTEHNQHVEISSRSSHMDRFALQSLQRQARMQADLDIAENDAAAQYRIRRRAEAFNVELQMELVFALGGSSR
jgi:hypothetical protein